MKLTLPLTSLLCGIIVAVVFETVIAFPINPPIAAIDSKRKKVTTTKQQQQVVVVWLQEEQQGSVISSTETTTTRLDENTSSNNKNDPTFRKTQKMMYPPPFRDISAEILGKSTNTKNKYAEDSISPIEAFVRKITMMSYIASMCVALPLTLAPIWVLSKTNLVDKVQTEIWAHDIGQTCARWLMMIMPFCEISVLTDHHTANNEEEEEEPTIWVCNHTSMLDTFVLLAIDYYLRGPNKRPIKSIYWKGLEANPVINLIFTLCGFIPVQMADNGSGNPNQYDKASFLNLLRQTKRAFQEGFDILILPEGQLNPWPERGLLEVFPGAHKLSLTSHRPIRMVGLHGLQNFWHPDDESILGVHVTARGCTVRGYSATGRTFETSEEFIDTFREVVGHFGANGVDHPNIASWMDGTAWNEKQQGRQLAPLGILPRHAAVPGDHGDVEQAIGAILELESQTAILESESDAMNNPKRSPVGVHMCKPPSTRISMRPEQRELDAPPDTLPRAGRDKEDTKHSPLTTMPDDRGDVEQAIGAILELESQTAILESESDHSMNNPKRSPVGVHMCKPPSTRISMRPEQRELDVVPLDILPRGRDKEDTKRGPYQKMQKWTSEESGQSDLMSGENGDVEQAIAAILELERQATSLESEVDPLLHTSNRSPVVGVHMCKPLSTRISLSP